jgi:hypothetical protein
MGQDSSASLVTRYGLDGPGIESRCGRNFPHLSRPALGHTQPPTQWVPGSSRAGKATEAWRWPPTPSSAEVKERVELYLYFPPEPSWPVIGWTLITGWTVPESKPGGSEIFRTRPNRPWGPPSLLYNGSRICFRGVKRLGRGVDHPSQSSAVVKEKLEHYFYFPPWPSWSVIGRTLSLYIDVVVYSCDETAQD